MIEAARPAVVLGYHRGGLALARGLGRAGVPVVGLGAYPSVAFRSRYFRERRVAVWRDGLGPDESLLQHLEEIAGRGPRPILFPDNDDGVSFCLDHWDEVTALADTPLPDDPDVVRRLRRKERLPAEAERAGVPAPATVLATSAETIQAAGLRPPLLVKPAEGKRFVRLFGSKAFVADSLDAAVAGWQRAADVGIDVIVQELIPDAVGSIWSLFAYIARDGEPLAAAVGRKRRELPPSFGSSTVFETHWSERVYEVGLRLLRVAGYRGFAHVELAWDRRDDSLQLIEVNTRVPVWASVAMGSRLNMARIAYDDLCGRPAAPLAILDRPVAWIDLQEELGRLAQVRIGPREFLAPYLRRRKARATFALDDPLPGAIAASRYVWHHVWNRPSRSGRRWLRRRRAVVTVRALLRGRPSGEAGGPS